MSICKLMICDFMIQSGEYDDFGAEQYTKEDLIEGIMWARWQKEELKLTRELFYEFNLDEFIKWAKQKLKDKKGRNEIY